MHKLIYTDGACRGNPGPGGWAFLLDGKLHVGHVDYTTNNVMELMAILMALRELPAHSNVTIATDSKFAVGAITGWHIKLPHIISLVSAIRTHVMEADLKVTYYRVKGHGTDPYNNAVDKAAVHASRQ